MEHILEIKNDVVKEMMHFIEKHCYEKVFLSYAPMYLLHNFFYFMLTFFNASYVLLD